MAWPFRDYMDPTVVIASMLALTGPVASSPAKTYSCTVKTVSSVDGRATSATMRVWGDGSTKWRIEQSIGGVMRLNINNGQDFWSVDIARKRALHARQQSRGLQFMAAHSRIAGEDLDAFRKQGGQPGGQETIQGTRCDVYRLRARTGLDYALWVIPGPDRLTKRKSETGMIHAAIRFGEPMANHRISRVTTYDDWQIGKPIPESMFRPPAGVKIVEAKPPAAGTRRNR